MWRSLTVVAAFLACACGNTTPASPASAPTSAEITASLINSVTPTALQAAAPNATLAGKNTLLVTVLQNQMPFGAVAPTEGSAPISGRVIVAPFLAGNTPATVSVLAVWLMSSGAVWRVPSFVETSQDARWYAVDFAGGPNWGPSKTVDVVALVTDGVTNQLIRAAAQMVSATYSGVGSLLDAPLTVSLAGKSLVASSDYYYNYFGGANYIENNGAGGGVDVTTTDGSDVPASVSATQLWMVNGDTVWIPTTLSRRALPNDIFGVGISPVTPNWGIASVFSVVSLTDGTSTVLLRTPVARISARPVS